MVYLFKVGMTSEHIFILDAFTTHDGKNNAVAGQEQ